MAKQKNTGAIEEVAPLFKEEEQVFEEKAEMIFDEENIEEEESETFFDENKEWKVIVPFYDLQQRKEVNIGDIVDHTELREELKLIEQA